MRTRNYTHVQKLLSEIEAIIQEGAPQAKQDGSWNSSTSQGTAKKKMPPLPKESDSSMIYGKCFHTCGYRRMWQWLKTLEGILLNPKLSYVS